jgi:4'-phosphopantetheinyl transferase
MSIFIYSSIYTSELSRVDLEILMNTLPKAIRLKAKKYKFWKDVYGCLFGKHLLKIAFLEAGLPHDLNLLEYTSYGKHYLQDGPDFNISHSGNRVVCVLSRNGKIGIDIEEIAAISFDDYRFQFSDAEWNAILSDSDPLSIFYHYWTAKESIVKAGGRGLQMNLAAINIGTGNKVVDGHSWNLRKIDIAEFYACHIAYERNIDAILVKELSPTTIINLARTFK